MSTCTIQVIPLALFLVVSCGGNRRGDLLIDAALDAPTNSDGQDAAGDASDAGNEPAYPPPKFTTGQAAALVLGQTTFSSATAGVSATALNSPRGVAVDPSTHKVFVADTNNRVLRFASVDQLTNGSAAEAVFGQADFTSHMSGLSTFRGNSLAFERGGRLWLADFSAPRALRLEAASTKTSGTGADGVLGQADLNAGTELLTRSGTGVVAGVGVDAAGRLWVADVNNSRVLRFDSAGTKANGADADGVIGQADFTSKVAAVSASGMTGPRGVAIDPTTGKLFVSDGGNHRVLRYSSSGALSNNPSAEAVLGQPDFTSKTARAGQNGMNLPYQLAFDRFGRLWVVDYDNNRVLWFNDASSKASGANADGVLGQPNFDAVAPATNATSFWSAVAVAVDSKTGGIWVTDPNNHRVLYFAPQP